MILVTLTFNLKKEQKSFLFTESCVSKITRFFCLKEAKYLHVIIVFVNLPNI